MGLIVAAAVAMPAMACINAIDEVILGLQELKDDALVADAMARLEAKYRQNPTFANTNDLAVGRILTRQYPEAIELLEEAEKRFPGKAIVAANLGTAFELSGNNTEALRWIREGVARDPREHKGTEWLHVKILEAKLAIERDPDWLKANTVLGVSFGSAEFPVMPPSLPTDEAGQQRSPASLYDAIRYQLKERTKFVKPPDAVIADLFAAQGDLVFAGPWWTMDWTTLWYPPNSYEQALRYGSAKRDLVGGRKQTFESKYTSESFYRRPANPAKKP